jgi:small GTP-binding protein
MSCFRCFRQRKRRVKLMFVGLDGAGKSTLLQTIVGDPEDFEPTVPTVGFHNVVLPSKRAFVPGFQVEVFDLGGGKRIRGIWQAYVSDVHAVVFVVDAADTARLDEARTGLYFPFTTFRRLWYQLRSHKYW